MGREVSGIRCHQVVDLITERRATVSLALIQPMDGVIDSRIAGNGSALDSDFRGASVRLWASDASRHAAERASNDRLIQCLQHDASHWIAGFVCPLLDYLS